MGHPFSVQKLQKNLDVTLSFHYLSLCLSSFCQSVVSGTGRKVCGKDLSCHPHTARPVILSQTVCMQWHRINNCHWIVVSFLS